MKMALFCCFMAVVALLVWSMALNAYLGNLERRCDALKKVIDAQTEQLLVLKQMIITKTVTVDAQQEALEFLTQEITDLQNSGAFRPYVPEVHPSINDYPGATTLEINPNYDINQVIEDLRQLDPVNRDLIDTQENPDGE